MPKIFFDSIDLIPDTLRDIVVEENGKHVIDVVPQVKLAEFRDNNVKLSKEKETLTSTLNGYKNLVGEDLEEFGTELTELRQTRQRVKDGELVENTNLETALAQRTQSMKADFENQLGEERKNTQTWKKKAEESDGKYKRSILEKAFTDVVLDEKNGVEPKALPDIINRASSVFHVEAEGQLIPRNGEHTIFGSDGASPMTPKEWVAKLKDDAPYFFKGSTGGGAAPGGNGGHFTAAQLKDMTPQQKMAAGRQR